MARQSESYGETAPFFPWLATMNAVPHAPLMRASEAWIESARVWQQEVARFASDRLRKDSEATRQFQECRDWGGMAKLYQQWLASAAQDYAELLGHLGKTAAKLGGDMAQSSSEAAEQSAEATRLAAQRRDAAA